MPYIPFSKATTMGADTPRLVNIGCHLGTNAIFFLVFYSRNFGSNYALILIESGLEGGGRVVLDKGDPPTMPQGHCLGVMLLSPSARGVGPIPCEQPGSTSRRSSPPAIGPAHHRGGGEREGGGLRSVAERFAHHAEHSFTRWFPSHWCRTSNNDLNSSSSITGLSAFSFGHLEIVLLFSGSQKELEFEGGTQLNFPPIHTMLSSPCPVPIGWAP